MLDLKTNSLQMQSSSRKQINSLENALQNTMIELREKIRDCTVLNERVERIADHLKMNSSVKVKHNPNFN